jgi:hypothetical protein
MPKDEFDIFFNQKVYPDPSEIFALKIPSINDIKDDCIFVFDTNVLLLPYVTGTQSLEQIEQVFERLIKVNRFKIPAQVAREFAKQRPNKISEMYQNIKRKRNGMPELSLGRFPLLENLDCYKEVLNLEKEFLELKKKYHKQLGELQGAVKTWNWDDPVSKLYRKLFNSSVIIDVSQEQKDIKEQLEYRYTHQIPPGYKDSNKKDDGIGDLLIWFSILGIAKAGKHVIFVSAEEKYDWFHRSEKDPIYPRFELTIEFMKASNNHAFHIIKLSELLELFNAKTEVIEEIALEEREINVVRRHWGHLVEKAALQWFQDLYNDAEFIRIQNYVGDFEIHFNDGEREIVEVLGLSVGGLKKDEQIKRKLDQLLESEFLSIFRKIYLVIILHHSNRTNEQEVLAFANRYLHQNNLDGRFIEVISGRLDEDLSFVKY